MEYLHAIATRFRATAPVADYWSLRLVSEETEHLAVRQGVTEPSALGSSLGAMLTLVQGGGIGYGATSDLSPAGLAAAWARAAGWAERHARLGLFGAERYPRSSLRADYASPVAEPWESLSLVDKLDLRMTPARPWRSTRASSTAPPGWAGAWCGNCWSPAMAVR